VLPDEPLQQGDVILWPHASGFLETSGIVVTADCDLARAKHWGRISVVPVFAVHTYVEELLAPKILTKHQPRLMQHFGKAIGNLLANQSGEAPSLDALEQLLGAAHLPVSLAADGQISAIHQILRQLGGWQKYESNLECLSSTFAILNLGGNEGMQNNIRSALVTLPGDVMPIPHFSGLPFDVSVAWLRVVREIPEKGIVRKMSDMAAASGIRVGRLSPVVRYRLTQMLAQVFSDIGLPEHHERLVKDQINGYISTLPKQPAKVGRSP
jgi:hypothetical protein